MPLPRLTTAPQAHSPPTLPSLPNHHTRPQGICTGCSLGQSAVLTASPWFPPVPCQKGLPDPLAYGSPLPLPYSNVRIAQQATWRGTKPSRRRLISTVGSLAAAPDTIL